MPEPLVEALPPSSAAGDPADRVTLDESVSFALLVVLESLTPAERTAWALHDLFGMPFAEVAQTVGRSPAAVRWDLYLKPKEAEAVAKLILNRVAVLRG